jgi:hypothetical protein
MSAMLRTGLLQRYEDGLDNTTIGAPSVTPVTGTCERIGKRMSNERGKTFP